MWRMRSNADAEHDARAAYGLDSTIARQERGGCILRDESYPPFALSPSNGWTQA